MLTFFHVAPEQLEIGHGTVRDFEHYIHPWLPYSSRQTCCTVSEDEEFCSILDQISNGCHYFIISDRRLGMLPNGFRNAKF